MQSRLELAWLRTSVRTQGWSCGWFRFPVWLEIYIKSIDFKLEMWSLMHFFFWQWTPRSQLLKCKYVVIIPLIALFIVSYHWEAWMGGRVLTPPALLSQLGCWSQQWWEGHVCVYIRQQVLDSQWTPLGHEYTDAVMNIMIIQLWIMLNATKYKLFYTCYHFKH